jgi:cytoskeleton protein RodZ
MVENFGSYLKHERELRGVPLEEISGATKIHIRFLKALEENSFDELPGEVFIKGYIRSYANIIGSDVEELLNIYKESVELKRNEGSISYPTSFFGVQPKTFLMFGLLILVVAVIFFGVKLLIKKGGNPEENKVPIIQEQAEAIVSNPSKSSDVAEKQIVEEITKKKATDPQLGYLESETLELSGNLSDQIVEGLGKKKVLSPQEPTEMIEQAPSDSITDLGPQKPGDMEKPLRLTIRAKEHSWFNMTIDNFREEDFILPTGTAKTFGANKVFRLTIGNKSGVELSLNGKLVTLPESENRVIKDFIINSKRLEGTVAKIDAIFFVDQ